MDLQEIALSAGKKQSVSGSAPADIITFIESQWGLNIKLFPVQRVILKAHYGLPLDNNPNDTEKLIKISDWRRVNWRTLTEAEYLRYLHREGRCNISEVVPGQQRRELILSIGRRSGKTFICACIAAYEVYRLLLRGCPQAYYGLPKTNLIGIISVATDKEQAGILYNEASGHFSNCPFFKPHTANNTQTYARFQTPYDTLKYGRYVDNPTAKASIKMTFKSCVSKGVRGTGNIVVILDELAHFNDSGESDAKKIYSAAKPSLAAFSPKDPLDSRIPVGDVEGRMISISSPLGRQGHFYDLFQVAMKGGLAAENMLAIQAPTWEVNPTVEAGFLESQYALDPVVFFTEYGAEFLDATTGWIENHDDLYACVNPVARPKAKDNNRTAHFMGVDIALVNDYSAVAIGHIEPGGVVVLDLIERIRAGEGAYKDRSRLDFDEVANWVTSFTKRFYVAKGLFDQWSGIAFEQALNKRGLLQFESQHFTKPLTSEVFHTFKNLMYDGKIVLYDWPREDQEDGTTTKHCDYIEELTTLQAKTQSDYITLVKAPKVRDAHDDYSDALVRMVWLASQELTNRKYIATPSANGPPVNHKAIQQLVRAQLKAKHQARLGGSSPDRQRSRINRGAVAGRSR